MAGDRLRLLAGKRDLFSPYHIPRALKYSEWDFERTPQITTSGSAITAFVDPITGASFSQGTGSAQPTLAATGFNGRQCATFDGGDSLRNTTALATLGWPTSGAFEIWALIEPVLVTGVFGTTFAYPNAGNGGIALQTRLDVDGVTTRARAGVGTGSSTATVDFIGFAVGRLLLRLVSDGTNCRLDANGVTGTTTAAAASFSGGPRNTIGGTAAVTAASLLTGKINFLALYRPLPTFYADKLTACLMARRGS